MAHEQLLLEFSGPFLNSLEALMLAQAQEGVWLRAVIGSCFPSVATQMAS